MQVHYCIAPIKDRHQDSEQLQLSDAVSSICPAYQERENKPLQHGHTQR